MLCEVVPTSIPPSVQFLTVGAPPKGPAVFQYGHKWAAVLSRPNIHRPGRGRTRETLLATADPSPALPAPAQKPPIRRRLAPGIFNEWLRRETTCAALPRRSNSRSDSLTRHRHVRHIKSVRVLG